MGAAAPPLPAAVARIAVAQICHSVGYDAADTSALRVLSDVAARYVLAVGRAAASASNSRGCTNANLLDVVVALEEVSLSRGFPAPPGPGLMDFVASVDEIPFARPIRRWRGGGAPPEASLTFAQLRLEPPSTHVPRWLPRFPDEWDGRQGRKAGKSTLLGWAAEETTPSPPVTENSATRKAPLSAERARVSFVFGSSAGRGWKKTKMGPSSSTRKTTLGLIGTRSEPVFSREELLEQNDNGPQENS
ncbi:unnamed protein product [Spirodela intermedia]|uniref:Bromodomain associated domain-containing protein n=1 Tax=Spirodela intermedia TaxID=51605 RepID=A0A7I8I8D4_SPIIN|nr:unnamed protein product [Spirodela intermedia]CAA6653927.1 unnamed protein product [Spirodela intermedia]